MRRPILNTQANKVNLSARTGQDVRITQELNGPALEKRLKQKRSKAYMEAMVQLDAHGAICDNSKVQELVGAMQKEFADLKPIQQFIGLVAKCNLGFPYEVHTLDIVGDIVDHYKKGRTLPDGLEKARILAQHPSYAFIEVYTNCICAVSDDGTVSYTRGGDNVR
ncbi:MAG: hypothetical protein K0R57_4310 [Paenibacillaceae bacterium]|nr:hypothetical protein [Paenibacillaceae bacterium]